MCARYGLRPVPAESKGHAISVSPVRVVEATLAVSVVRSFVTFVEGLGVPRETLLRGTGIHATDLESDRLRVSRSAAFGVFERGLGLAEDPALALHWGEYGVSGLAFAPLSCLISHAATLGDALELLGRYGKLLSDEASFEVVDLGAYTAIRTAQSAGTSPRTCRFLAEFIMFGFYRLLRGFTLGARSVRVDFAHVTPTHSAEYARLFEGRARFGTPHTELVFDKVELSVSSPLRDDDVRDALCMIAERRLVRLNMHVPYAVRVREALLVRAANRATMQTIARQLGMSVRSLRRRLSHEQTTYNSVACEALVIAAKRCLRERGLSVQETAFELGFSDTSTFHRAFKRWTGTTPSVFRDGCRRPGRRSFASSTGEDRTNPPEERALTVRDAAGLGIA